jgi:hypothetical protein
MIALDTCVGEHGEFFSYQRRLNLVSLLDTVTSNARQTASYINDHGVGRYKHCGGRLSARERFMAKLLGTELPRKADAGEYDRVLDEVIGARYAFLMPRIHQLQAERRAKEEQAA